MVDARLRVVELALRTAILVINTESLRKPGDPVLGFSAVNYGNLFVRDRWTLFSIARELGCSMDELLGPPEVRGSGPRWSELVDAAEVVLAEVQKLERAVRLTLILRSCGAKWSRVLQHLPGRVLFSVVDEADAGLATLDRTCTASIAILSSYDETPRIRKKTKRIRQTFLLRTDQKDAMVQAY